VGKLKQLRRLGFFGSVVLVASLMILPPVLGEGSWISVVALGGWVLIAICGLMYMYYFFRGDK
jgi:hypothetical protein